MLAHAGPEQRVPRAIR